MHWCVIYAGRNPHLGHLAWGDAFVVTADSVSMLSEACSTGKPVYVIGGERCRWKFVAFQKSLRQRGLTRDLTGAEDVCSPSSTPSVQVKSYSVVILLFLP
jgi:mitochondrial fission protein ELM1